MSCNTSSKINCINFYFQANEARLDKQTKHFEVKREALLQ